MTIKSAVHYLSAGASRSWSFTDWGLQDAEPAEGAQLVVVVDFSDEMHSPATVPLVRGSDGALLRRRRLEREFPGVTLSAMLPITRRRREGVEEVVMIAAGADNDVQETLEALSTRHAISGIYTPALLVAAWLRRARLMQGQVLVVLPTPAGMRLVFVDAGRPLLSRLTPPLSSGTTGVEIARTIQYLQNTQRIAAGDALELWFWGVSDAEAESCLPTGVPFRVGAAPAVKGLPDPESDGFTALLDLAASGAPGVQLGADKLRLGWFARQVSHWSRLAALAAAAGAALLAGGLELQAWQAARLSRDLHTERAAFEGEKAALVADLAARGLTVEDVHLLPDVESRLLSTEVGLGEVSRVVGSAFGADADVLVQSLEFHSAHALLAYDGAGHSCGTEQGEPGAILQVDFRLAEDIDVRRRTEALAAVRTQLLEVDGWRSSRAAVQIGQREPLVVKAGTESADTGGEWAACLWRGVAS